MLEGFEGFAFAAGKGTAPESAERNFALGVDGFRYGDLYEAAKLAELDARFRAELGAFDADLAKRFEAYRAGETLTPPAESEMLIATARPLATFVARLFRVDKEHEALLARAAREDVIFRMKAFIARRAIKKYPETGLPADEPSALRTAVRTLCATKFPELIATGDDELTFATMLAVLLASEAKEKEAKEKEAKEKEAKEADPTAAIDAELAGRLDLFERWAAVHRFAPSGREAVKGWCRSTSRTTSTTTISCSCVDPTKSCPTSPTGRSRTAGAATASASRTRACRRGRSPTSRTTACTATSARRTRARAACTTSTARSRRTRSVSRSRAAH